MTNDKNFLKNFIYLIYIDLLFAKEIDIKFYSDELAFLFRDEIFDDSSLIKDFATELNAFDTKQTDSFYNFLGFLHKSLPQTDTKIDDAKHPIIDLTQSNPKYYFANSGGADKFSAKFKRHCNLISESEIEENSLLQIFLHSPITYLRSSTDSTNLLGSFNLSTDSAAAFASSTFAAISQSWSGNPESSTDKILKKPKNFSFLKYFIDNFEQFAPSPQQKELLFNFKIDGSNNLLSYLALKYVRYEYLCELIKLTPNNEAFIDNNLAGQNFIELLFKSTSQFKQKVELLELIIIRGVDINNCIFSDGVSLHQYVIAQYRDEYIKYQNYDEVEKSIHDKPSELDDYIALLADAIPIKEIRTEALKQIKSIIVDINVSELNGLAILCERKLNTSISPDIDDHFASDIVTGAAARVDIGGAAAAVAVAKAGDDVAARPESKEDSDDVAAAVAVAEDGDDIAASIEAKEDIGGAAAAIAVAKEDINITGSEARSNIGVATSKVATCDKDKATIDIEAIAEDVQTTPATYRADSPPAANTETNEAITVVASDDVNHDIDGTAVAGVAAVAEDGDDIAAGPEAKEDIGGTAAAVAGDGDDIAASTEAKEDIGGAAAAVAGDGDDIAASTEAKEDITGAAAAIAGDGDDVAAGPEAKEDITGAAAAIAEDSDDIPTGIMRKEDVDTPEAKDRIDSAAAAGAAASLDATILAKLTEAEQESLLNQLAEGDFTSIIPLAEAHIDILNSSAEENILDIIIKKFKNNSAKLKEFISIIEESCFSHAEKLAIEQDYFEQLRLLKQSLPQAKSKKAIRKQKSYFSKLDEVIKYTLTNLIAHKTAFKDEEITLAGADEDSSE